MMKFDLICRDGYGTAVVFWTQGRIQFNVMDIFLGCKDWPCRSPTVCVSSGVWIPRYTCMYSGFSLARYDICVSPVVSI